MGEVLGALIILLIVGIIVTGGITVVVKMNKPDPSTVESPAYRNHQSMARWIERALNDDMVRVTVPEDMQRDGRRILSSFYGEHERK